MPTYTEIKHNGRTYFSETELKCKGTGKLILADGFAEKLLELRLRWNKPMIINSACRDAEYNLKVGGSPKSYHICNDERGGCSAIDVRCNNGKDRLELVRLGIELGWSIGVNKSFIHLDQRSLLGIEPVLFTY